MLEGDELIIVFLKHLALAQQGTREKHHDLREPVPVVTGLVAKRESRP